MDNPYESPTQPKTKAKPASKAQSVKGYRLLLFLLSAVFTVAASRSLYFKSGLPKTIDIFSADAIVHLACSVLLAIAFLHSLFYKSRLGWVFFTTSVLAMVLYESFW